MHIATYAEFIEEQVPSLIQKNQSSMQEYRIPEEYLKAFDILYAASGDTLAKLYSQLEHMPPGKHGQAFVEALSPYADNGIVLSAIFSMGELISDSNADIEKTSSGLSSAYFYQSEINPGEDGQKKLSHIIFKLLNSWKSGRMTFKSMKLYGHNPRIFQQCNIASDIRLIFEDDLRNMDRNALIIHQLKIAFTGDDNRVEEFFVSLTYKDLHNIKEQVNRAIEKEHIIKEDYEGKIKFISLNDSNL